MRVIGIVVGITFLLWCVAPLRAAPKRVRLLVSPQAVELDSRRAYRQLVVTAEGGDAIHDVTHTATYRVSDRRVVAVMGGRVLPLGNGRATLQITAEGQTCLVPVVVAHFEKPDSVSFKFETLATLTKQGCATGSCHGSPHGKGGFSLSLFGYDPTIDRISLTHDGFNRRVNVMEPADSLMLKKPLLELPHVGGKRLHKSDASYRILKEWIYEGANVALPSVECTGIVLTPGQGRVLHRPYLSQQISVLAAYSDGTTRDVTEIATYETSNAAVATVDADGLVTGHGRGQAAISVRYLDRLQSVYFTVVEDIPGFVWKSPPESNFVDRLVDAKLKQLQYLPSGTCRDEEFLRRVSLDLAGMLPTPQTTREFLNDRSPDRRAKLVDRLLETEEYARFQGLKLADLMRITPDRLSDGRAKLFADWITESVRKNQPYDAFAREILTAVGDTEQIPTANYFLAIPTMEERTEMTSQIFMGTRVECAKCHNHPFENWTMRDYYSIAAVFARTTADKGVVKLASAGEALLPTTRQVMSPWGAAHTAQQGGADRRVAFAFWLTRPDNPYFAYVAVNRIWADLMGRGIVEPVDDFRSSNPPSNVPLLNALAQEFVRSGYDRKHILRIICNSETYQRTAQPNRFNVSDEALFSHAKVRLLTAEQLKDAIGLATRVLEPTSTLAPKIADLSRQVQARAALLEPGYATWLAQREAEMRAKAKAKKDEPPSRLSELLMVPEGQRTAPQQVALHGLFLAEDGEYRGMKARLDTLTDRLDYATQRPYPEQSGFTTTFGQPARQTACTCERQHAPTLLQALELLNGGTAFQMAQASVARYRACDDDRFIEELYLSSLCRFPTVKERETARAYLKRSADRDIARMDLVWTIINTQEFLFQH